MALFRAFLQAAFVQTAASGRVGSLGSEVSDQDGGSRVLDVDDVVSSQEEASGPGVSDADNLGSSQDEDDVDSGQEEPSSSGMSDHDEAASGQHEAFGPAVSDQETASDQDDVAFGQGEASSPQDPNRDDVAVEGAASDLRKSMRATLARVRAAAERRCRLDYDKQPVLPLGLRQAVDADEEHHTKLFRCGPQCASSVASSAAWDYHGNIGQGQGAHNLASQLRRTLSRRLSQAACEYMEAAGSAAQGMITSYRPEGVFISAVIDDMSMKFTDQKLGVVVGCWMSVLQHVTLLRRDTSPRTFQVHMPCVLFPDSSAAVLWSGLRRWLWWSASGAGERLAAFWPRGLARDLRVRVLCLVMDGAAPNETLFHNERSLLASLRRGCVATDVVGSGFDMQLAFRLLCAVHSLCIIRKDKVFAEPTLWPNLVRFGHLCEGGSFERRCRTRSDVLASAFSIPCQ